MKHPVVPYAVPKKIEPRLARVLAYWQRLKRAENNMPFCDDVTMSSLAKVSDRLMLINAFAKPERFRLESVGQRLIDRYGERLAGNFIDEIEPRNPFEYLGSQCSATVESGVPTYYRRGPSKLKGARGIKPYARLLLPLWGNGRVEMLLGAADWR